MANPVEIPVKTEYDDAGFKQLIRDTKRQIAEQKRLGNLTKRLDREIARERKAAQAAGRRRLAQLKKIAREQERAEKAAKRAAAARRAQAKEVATGLAAGLATLAALTAETVRAADEAQKTERAFFGLSGGAEEAARNMTAMERATKGLVSEQQQQQIANQLLGMQIVTTADEMEKVVNVSRRLGAQFKGLGAAEAAEEFAIMIANMSTARLDSFGISSGIVKQRIDELMATTEGMTREQAFFIATMEEGEKVINRLGPELEGPTEKVQRLQASFADMEVAIGGVVLALGDAGLFDVLTGMIERLTEGAKAWQGIIETIDRATEAVNRVNEAQGRFQDAPTTGFEAMEQQFGMLAVSQEDLAEAYTEIVAEEAAAEEAANNLAKAQAELTKETQGTADATNAAAEATKAAAEAAEEEEKRLEKVAGIKRDAIKKLIEIDEKAQEETLAAQKQFQKDMEDAEKQHAKRVSQIKKDLAKAIKKSITDENRTVKRLQEDAAKADTRKEKTRQIDAMADERLFQFELRNLAAEGNAIAIEQALERREIEGQIAEEKAANEDQVEVERRATQIERLKEDAAIRRAELKSEAADALATEKESFAERTEELKQFHAEKLADIEKNKEKAIQKLGEELAEAGDLTATELGELAVIAGKLGVGIGENLAEGIQSGFALNERIASLLGELDGGGGGGGGGGAQPVTQMPVPELTPLQQTQGVQFGGSFRVGGSGGPDSQLIQLRATPGETITATPPGQGGNITINASGVGVQQLVAILEGKVNEGLQEYTDTILAPALGGS